MRIRWEHVAGDPGPVTYYVDDVAVGMDDAGFDRVLELVADSDAGVTIEVGEPSSTVPAAFTTRCPSALAWKSSKSASGVAGSTTSSSDSGPEADLSAPSRGWCRRCCMPRRAHPR